MHRICNIGNSIGHLYLKNCLPWAERFYEEQKDRKPKDVQEGLVGYFNAIAVVATLLAQLAFTGLAMAAANSGNKDLNVKNSVLAVLWAFTAFSSLAAVGMAVYFIWLLSLAQPAQIKDWVPRVQGVLFHPGSLVILASVVSVVAMGLLCDVYFTRTVTILTSTFAGCFGALGLYVVYSPCFFMKELSECEPVEDEKEVGHTSVATVPRKDVDAGRSTEPTTVAVQN